MHKIIIEPHNVSITVEDGTLLKDSVEKYGIDFPCGGKGVCGNCHIELLEGNLEISDKQKEILIKKGLQGERWRLSCLCHVHNDIRIKIPKRKQIILSDNKPTTHREVKGHAIAIDLGSTTIVAQLIDRQSGNVVNSISEINSQNSYGADIISRISYAMISQDHAWRLTNTIREQIKRMIETLTQNANIYDIHKIAIVGNSVMHHLFCNLDITPLSSYPFQSEHNESIEFTPNQLQWNLPKSCRIIFMPNISHFVGSDILAGIYHLGLHKTEKYNALIDLGTNGEIVIGNKNKLLCTSTAAGPAFEGINIINGMRAVSGAICHIDTETGKIKVIGDIQPTGICGSGLIETIHYKLKQGEITSDGRINNDKTSLSIIDNINLFDKDIREFQLAKAAIATGFELLVKQLGITTNDIEHVFIGGGLGNYLNINKALELGLIKDIKEKSISKAGNSALAGCKEFSFDIAEIEATKILSIISHYSLETDPNFQDSYCMNLFLA